MLSLPLLSITIFLPLVGAAAIMINRGGSKDITAENARWVALWTSVVTFVLSIVIWANFEDGISKFQFVEKFQWMPLLNINYHVGIDGISLPFILLSTFLTPICILSSWQSVKKQVPEYMVAFLVMETLMIGMFASLDLFIFYIFFEGVLIPMYLIIGIWGGPDRVYASFKFFMYTLLGSVLMLLAIIYIYYDLGSGDIPLAIMTPFDPKVQIWLWLAFFASFAVKIPMWPVHTWLPDAHVEAPTAGSVILAAVLLKMGGYGFLRFSVPMFPEASEYFAPFVFTLSVIAIIYTSLVALAQTDMKKLIAYSSVAHMGFVTLGIFTLGTYGIQGAVIQMISHGLISAGLFLAVGVVYDRIHTREISAYGGLVHNMPLYARAFMVLILASSGLPGTSGFVGEFLVLLGTYEVSKTFTILAATGMVLGAAYGLWLYRRVVFGKLEKTELLSIKDLTSNERWTFASLVALILWIGVYPMPVINLISPSVEHMIHRHSLAMDPDANWVEEEEQPFEITRKS